MLLDLYAALALYLLATVQPSVLYWGVISPFVPSTMFPVMVSLVLLAALAFYGIDRAIQQRAIRAGDDRDNNAGCGATRVRGDSSRDRWTGNLHLPTGQLLSPVRLAS